MQESFTAEMLDCFKQVRIALRKEYSYFTHDTSFDRLAKIQNEGLNVNPVMSCPPEVLWKFGDRARWILCLHPVGSITDEWLRPSSSSKPPYVRLAIVNEDLPCSLGLDWSYEHHRNEQLRNELRDQPPIDASLGIARRRGSIASYDAIQPWKLRVWTKGLPDDPQSWPPLIRTPVEEAHTWGHDDIF
jgi:hypothetical protein